MTKYAPVFSVLSGLFGLLLVGVLLLSPLPAFAASAVGGKDPDGFEVINSDMMQKGESIPADRLVAAAYGFLFGAMMIWVASVTSRTRKAEEELAALRKRLEK